MNLSSDAARLLDHMHGRHPRRTWYRIAEHIFAANGGDEYRRTSRAWGELTRKELTTTVVNDRSFSGSPDNIYKELTELGLSVAQERHEARLAYAAARMDLYRADAEVAKGQDHEGSPSRGSVLDHSN